MTRVTYGAHDSPHGHKSYLKAASNDINYDLHPNELNVGISQNIIDFYIKDMKKKKILSEQAGPTEKQLVDHMINSVFPEPLYILLLEQSKNERFNLALVVKNLPIPKKMENLFVSNLPEDLREMYFNNPLKGYKK